MEHDWTEKPKTASIENILKLRRQLLDRMPAMVTAIRVHPDYFDVFMADLRENGVSKVAPDSEIAKSMAFTGIPIYKDATVPFGEMREVFAGDKL